MNKKVIVGIVSLLVLAGLMYKGRTLLKERQERIAKASTPMQRTIEVALAYAKKGSMANRFDVNAEVQAKKSVAVSTRVSGYITKLHVSESQRVRKGDLLISLDDADLKSDIETLQTTLKAQQKDAEHALRVYRNNIAVHKAGGLAKEKLEASRIAYELKQAQVNATKQKLARAHHQYEYTRIKAPFDGVIDMLRAHEGDLAAPGRPLLTMSDTEQKVLFTFSPELGKHIRPQMKAYRQDTPIGHIAKIYPSAKQGLSVAEVALTSPLKLPSGAYLALKVEETPQKGCIVPSDTLLHKKDGTYVLLYDEKKKTFKIRRVTPLVATPKRTLIAECFQAPIAQGSEATLSQLQTRKDVRIRGLNDGK